jgi:DNA-binding MarR family transcriptional regulator
MAVNRSQKAEGKRQKSEVRSLKSEVKRQKAEGGGPLALNRLVHERLRLGILSALAVNQSLTFNDLKALLHTTDGNLSVHARKLEDADYVACDKTFRGRVPVTVYRLTNAGRRALEKYIDHMEAIIGTVKPEPK